MQEQMRTNSFRNLNSDFGLVSRTRDGMYNPRKPSWWTTDGVGDRSVLMRTDPVHQTRVCRQRRAGFGGQMRTGVLLVVHSRSVENTPDIASEACLDGLLPEYPRLAEIGKLA